MKAVHVQGRFLTPNMEPIEGEISFVPQLIWVDEGETTYPTLAPEVTLDNGNFDVELTETHSETYGDWFYQVICPLGVWHISVQGDGPYYLKDLLPDHVIKRD